MAPKRIAQNSFSEENFDGFAPQNDWQLLHIDGNKSEGWIKEIRVLPIEHVGCLVNTSTRQLNDDGTIAISESTTFVPGTIFRWTEGEEDDHPIIEVDRDFER